jgi:hypothetical protein
MLKKFAYLLMLIPLTASASLAQSRTMYIGDVELRIGMSRDVAMKLLAGQYNVTAMGDASNFSISRYNQQTQLHDFLGVVAFENNELTYISRGLDMSGWPNDEGFAVARVIYDALNGSISKTDSDGAKRGIARIVIGSGDMGKPNRGNMRTIALYVNERRISISIWDGADGGRTVNASIAISKKPW